MFFVSPIGRRAPQAVEDAPVFRGETAQKQLSAATVFVSPLVVITPT
jgi:hypothetical protein